MYNNCYTTACSYEDACCTPYSQQLGYPCQNIQSSSCKPSCLPFGKLQPTQPSKRSTSTKKPRASTESTDPCSSYGVGYSRSKNRNGMKRTQTSRMEPINEDCECPCAEEEPENCDTSKKIQESCADFLSIVHDTVLETVQKSVECILRDYFMFTMEKIECLCSKMMRNECLLSKMYLDILEKIEKQDAKNLEHFQCICSFLTNNKEEIQKEKEPENENPDPDPDSYLTDSVHEIRHLSIDFQKKKPQIQRNKKLSNAPIYERISNQSDPNERAPYEMVLEDDYKTARISRRISKTN